MIEALTINKMCGSGLKAIMLADQAIRCGDAELVFAGGMESMSNAPHLLTNLRNGERLGHSTVIDSLVHDGLWDVYTQQHMGSCAELLVEDRKYSRKDQDNFAIKSYSKACSAIKIIFLKMKLFLSNTSKIKSLIDLLQRMKNQIK